MNKYLSLSVLASALVVSSCSDEPKNMECDIESASVHVDDPSSIFYQDADTLVAIPVASDSIGFGARYNASVSKLPLTLKVTPGANVFILDEAAQPAPFHNGQLVDFSDDRIQVFRVVSEDGAWHRDYRICVAHLAKPSSEARVYTFDFNGNYALNDPNKTINDKQCYFVWTETDSTNVNDIFGNESWKCGNPGFKLSKSSAKPMEYPSVPVIGGGPDGSDCVKLETMDTGAFGKMVNMRMAAGSLFIGSFDVSNALKDALKATIFGTPFTHKPVRMSVWLKFEQSTAYQDKQGNPVADLVDEPDAYFVMYRNQDENGNKVVLDGNNVLTSPHIVGVGRLPHNYDWRQDGDRQVWVDKVGNSPIHGLTNQWQDVTLEMEYTQPLDPDILENYGYSLIIGFASSWQGAYFNGAIGNKLYIDNIRLECE